MRGIEKKFFENGHTIAVEKGQVNGLKATIVAKLLI